MASSTWTGFTEEDQAKIRIDCDYSGSKAISNGTISSEAILKNETKTLNGRLNSKNPTLNDTCSESMPSEASVPKEKSPTHVKLRVIEDGKKKSFEIMDNTLSTEEIQATSNKDSSLDHSSCKAPEDVEKKGGTNLDEFERRHKLIEEQNRLKKEMLGKALTLRKMKTQAEAKKLCEIQKELTHLDVTLSTDVLIIRNHIEVTTMALTEAERRYIRAEKELIEAKKLLFEKREQKELLTQHLCTIIEQNEMRKAHRLTELMIQLSLQDQEKEATFIETTDQTSL